MQISPLRLALALLAALAAACDRDTRPAPSAPTLVPSGITFQTHPPALFLSGSQVTITARVRDANGANVSGAVVRFATTAGTLSAASATTDAAGLATVTLSGAGAATVTATLDGATASLEIPAVAPFTVRLRAPSRAVVGPTSVAMDIVPASGFASPPGPLVLTLDCGMQDGPVQLDATASRHTCRYLEPDDYTVTGIAAADNGWSTSATAAIEVYQTSVPDPPPPPASNPVSPGVSIETLALQADADSATWRFRAVASGGKFTGDVDWSYDYTQDPANGSHPDDDPPAHEPDTLTVDVVDVTYTSDGTREITVTAEVENTSVTATVRIEVQLQ